MTKDRAIYQESKVTEKTINNIRQNKIRYLVRDFEEYSVPEEVTRGILLKRGINKWLANRMEIIHLKDELKQAIKNRLALMNIMKALSPGKQSKEYKEVLGNLKTLIVIRYKLRQICHNSRWVFPD